MVAVVIIWLGTFGGVGGGGNGGGSNFPGAGVGCAGVANTGAGGGGSGCGPAPISGGAGGPGVVIIRSTSGMTTDSPTCAPVVYNGTHYIAKFKASANLTVGSAPAQTEADYLVVGGGGAGGYSLVVAVELVVIKHLFQVEQKLI